MNANLFARNDHKLENQNKIFDFNKAKQQNWPKILEAIPVEMKNKMS